MQVDDGTRPDGDPASGRVRIAPLLALVWGRRDERADARVSARRRGCGLRKRVGSEHGGVGRSVLGVCEGAGVHSPHSAGMGEGVA